MKKFALSLLFSATVFFISSAQNALTFEQYKLDNGLTVILNEDHTQPKVFGSVVCKAGGKNDPEDATGMAHYQEHMLFKGTEQLGTSDWEKEKPYIDKIFALYDQLGKTEDEAERKEIHKKINEASLKASEYAIPNELSNLIKSMGGTGMNAGTGWDMTVFYNAFPPNQIEKWIDLYSHRFMNPVFRGFQAELEVVYEEKNMYSDIFFFPILEKFNLHFFKEHPYGQQTLIGTADDLKNPSLTKMYDFYKQYYVANNMALIISGDFDSEKIKPLIKKKFGKWESGKIPEAKTYKEEPFDGREFYEYKLSPIKLALFGFRTVPKGHPDEAAIKVCNALMTNSNQTGLLDRLAAENKIMAAQAFSMSRVDHGSGVFLLIPKIVGQSLEDAEKLMFKQIERIKSGDFPDWMLQAVKNQLYVHHRQSIENIEMRTNLLASNFVLGKKPEEILNFPERIKNLTKKDIVEVANKYYGDNFIAFYSKMGKADPDKIAKPDYKPIVSKNKEKSEYAKHFASIPSTEYKPEFVDINKDVQVEEINNFTNLYYVQNNVNDIFEMEIRFKAGKNKIHRLNYATQLMAYAGAGEYSSNELKAEFNKIGCNYSVSASKHYTSLRITGLEKNIRRALELTNLLINQPVAEQDKISKLLENAKTERKMERSEPDGVAAALFEYVKYGNKSSYLTRASMKEIKKFEADKLIDIFKKVRKYEAEIHYTGSPEIISQTDLTKLVKSELKLQMQSKKSDYEPQKIKEYDENTVFVVHKKKARQSKIFFLINGAEYNKEERAVIEAFNLYFGGGFSGLVLQEVREYRSLAYTAAANYSKPPKEGIQAAFIGYIGTQADKTLEALDIFTSLVRDMPEKTERMEMIRSYLTLSQITKKPGFRRLSTAIQAWKRMGYDQDPAKALLKEYKKLSFADIKTFYEKNIKNKPMVIAFVGDTKEIDIEELKKYGKIVEIKEKDLFNE